MAALKLELCHTLYQCLKSIYSYKKVLLLLTTSPCKMSLHTQLSSFLFFSFNNNILSLQKASITLLRVIPTTTFIRFVTDKSSGILSDISSGILSGISSGILSGTSSGILPGISSSILSDMLSSALSGIKNPCICRAWSSRTQHPKRDFTWMKLAVATMPRSGDSHQAPPRRGVNHNHPQGDTLAEVHLHLKAPGTTTPGG